MRGNTKEWEFWFAKAEAEAKALPPAGPQQNDLRELGEDLGRFSEIVKISPRAGMLELRRVLEERVKAVAEVHRIEKDGKPPSMLGAIKGLRERSAIDSATAELLLELRAMGNTAAHGSDDAIGLRRLSDITSWCVRH